MGAFFKMLSQTGDRKKRQQEFVTSFRNNFGHNLSEDMSKSFRSCLLSINAGSNKGSIEDCIRIFYRELNRLNESNLTKEEKTYFLTELRKECFDGTIEKYGYWWARQIIDEQLDNL